MCRQTERQREVIHYYHVLAISSLIDWWTLIDLEEQWKKMGNMMGSTGTQWDFFNPCPNPWTFFTSQFGHMSNKTISKYGNPSPGLMQTPPSLLYFSSSLSAAGPTREAAKFIFTAVVPLGWRWGPCHATADVLGEGPWRHVGGTLLSLHHSILLFLLKVLSFSHGQSEQVSVSEVSQR